MKRTLVETYSADSSDDLGVKELNPIKRGRKTLLIRKFSLLLNQSVILTGLGILQ
jgi:hypothetical protein